MNELIADEDTRLRKGMGMGRGVLINPIAILMGICLVTDGTHILAQERVVISSCLKAHDLRNRSLEERMHHCGHTTSFLITRVVTVMSLLALFACMLGHFSTFRVSI